MSERAGYPLASLNGLHRRSAAEVEMRRVSFLDGAGMIPRASVVVVFGRSGLGKTLYVQMLAAAASAGKLPGASGPLTVLYSSGEDDPESVLVPRFVAAGADLERIHFLERGQLGESLRLPDEGESLAEQAREAGAGLIVLDPIATHLAANVDAHRDADVRRALQPLNSVASDLNLTVLVVAHPRKGSDGDALSRIAGSGAFGNAPRSVIVLGLAPDDEEGERGPNRVVAHSKCNVGRKAESLAARIDTRPVEIEGAPASIPVLVIDGASPYGADDVVDRREMPRSSEADEAREWLEAQLTAELPIRSVELIAAAEAQGISKRTLERARGELGVKSRQGPDGWYVLPPGRSRL